MPRLSAEYNLAANNPALAAEWHPTKNGDLKPTDVTPWKSQKVWWLGKCGHEWCAEIKSRNKGSTCPICCGRQILEGVNDLATMRPDLAAEWHPTKNGGLKPTDVSIGSRASVYWRDKYGHEWKARVKNRGCMMQGCPICKKHMHTSFPEQAIFFYTKMAFSDTANGNTDIIGMELDVYIESIKTAIEYDGKAWHKDGQEKEKKKNRLCKEHGVRLIRVREHGLCSYDDCECIERTDLNLRGMNAVIKQLLELLGVTGIDVDIDRDAVKIMSQYSHQNKTHNIQEVCPDILVEWNYEKNEGIEPSSINANSHAKMWWRCKKCGYEWRARVSHRVHGSGCPVCAGQHPAENSNLTTTPNHLPKPLVKASGLCYMVRVSNPAADMIHSFGIEYNQRYFGEKERSKTYYEQLPEPQRAHPEHRRSQQLACQVGERRLRRRHHRRARRPHGGGGLL